jgi:hypothetical protein
LATVVGVGPETIGLYNTFANETMDYDDRNIPILAETHPPPDQNNPEGFFTALAILFVVTVIIVVLLLRVTPQ